MLRRPLLIGLLLLGVWLSPAPSVGADAPARCQPAATSTTVQGTFPATLPFPLLQAAVVGLTGSYEGHVVFQPLAAGPPALAEGCKESSRFTLTNFTGRLIATLPQLGQVTVLDTGTQPINATLTIHFGTEPNKPILTFRSDRPVTTIFGTVQFIQIVGGQVVQAR